MRKTLYVLALLFFFGFFIQTSTVGAEEVSDISVCEPITDAIEKNLCMALHPIKNPENRYRDKDHSSYYCSLMEYQKDRDMMNFCSAIVKSDASICANIGSVDLEKTCVECSSVGKAEIPKKCFTPRAK
ncbi:MAG: hypothetical protein COV66_11490 [Nitrospinae bacterium CG11_big_fil_rev_8_21_14_0_20_45_15]|nr:MAG: hypothetical protein COV66_11490 [Nitrospinae bacterium CG11_big_fil_rev_8_21_14_0_20_45_15]